jgi:hypothetical protein
MISTLFCLKFHVLKKCIFDLNAEMTFSRSKHLTSEFDFEEKYGGHFLFASNSFWLWLTFHRIHTKSLRTVFCFISQRYDFLQLAYTYIHRKQVLPRNISFTDSCPCRIASDSNSRVTSKLKQQHHFIIEPTTN